MSIRKSTSHARLLCSVAGAAMLACAGPARAEDSKRIEIAPQSLASALHEFGVKSGHQVLFKSTATNAKTSPGAAAEGDMELALTQLLAGTGMSYRRAGDVFLIEPEGASGPQSGSAAGGGAEVEALIVTAQKREEDIQDVPIAISAFSQEDLTRSQIAGGPDLITQVPNMTFTKTNFSSYSIQLRGIGTQAISATVDPAVAVAFNNTPFIRNRFFEQEFYDLQRIEVLRGPQGTLYGRNATAGVVNLISAKPKLATYEAKLSGDVANYSSSRLEGMLNIPLAEDVAALRIAGAWTKREGYATNELTGNPIDGRDLWSTRVSLRFAPTDALDVNLIWEHFEEDDDRIRSGKQLCKTDVATEAAGIPITDFYQLLRNTGQDGDFDNVQSAFSQGCLPASLYSPDSFQKTNSLALPYYVPLGAIELPIRYFLDENGNAHPADPYASRTQSTDLRVIEAAVDPSYRAKTDIAEVQVSFDLTDNLTLNSETAWASDFIFSTQDYNRFAGAPHSWDTTRNPDLVTKGILSPDGFFCDPQIGCSDRLVAMDLSTARSRQFSQELRLASDFEGPFNFSLGGNFLRYDTEDKYYVFINSITLLAAHRVGAGVVVPPWEPGVSDNRTCLPSGLIEPDYSKISPVAVCTYIDPNPVDSLNDLGHNYFLSKNPFKLISYAAFGEAYYDITDNLKVTAGLRWTVDKKEAPYVPSWIFAGFSAGHPVVETVRQEWREPTGRLTIDWKPDLGFTDETMVYASYGHGYKAGGMNPPAYGKTMYGDVDNADLTEALARASATHPKTFGPEFIDAFELGSKNTLLDGALTMNVAAFYYDYKGYQLSQIVDRAAVTQNFDSEVWGLELESDWRPMENLKFGLKLGYEKTKVADGMRAIDVMDRTAGNDAWLVTKPFPSLPTNCVLPAWLFLGNDERYPGNPDLVDVGGKAGGNPGGCEQAYLLGNDPATNQPYVSDPFAAHNAYVFRWDIDYAAWSTNRDDYPCLPTDVTTIGVMDYPGVDPQCLIAASNNGEGFYKDLSGNELPNAPNMTATITADYTVPLPQNWLVTLHTDLYYQSESWTRIFNTEGYDKLKAYSNINLAAIFTNEDAGWRVMAYVKNVLDRDSITGAFLNSDDSGLTTNVFLTEPRLYGLRVTKDFQGEGWWTEANLGHEGPYPLMVELGGQAQRHDAPYVGVQPAFVESLNAESNPMVGLHNRDLDWGDGRSIKLTFRPRGAWSISAGIRQSQSNNDRAWGHSSTNRTETICGAQDPFFVFLVCDPTSPLYDDPAALSLRTANFIEWADASVRSAEEQTIIDFDVGMDVGFGGLSDSTVKAGIRHADIQSSTVLFGQAQGGWDIPEGWVYVNSTYNHYESNIEAEREFKGAGPTLTWDAAMALLGDERTGHLKADWSVGVGVLFGEQETSATGEEQVALHSGVLSGGTDSAFNQVGEATVISPPETRTKSVTVPAIDLSLGLSYDVGRIKVGAGYRWERYFDVLDVGYAEAKDGDRTIDGPYFKIAVGFGG